MWNNSCITNARNGFLHGLYQTLLLLIKTIQRALMLLQGQSSCLERIRSATLLQMFLQSAVAGIIFQIVVYCGGGIVGCGANNLDMLLKRNQLISVWSGADFGL